METGEFVRITVLGAIQLVESGRSYLPTAPKERQLMALLLMNAGRVVPISACLSELWPERAPRTARTTLQTYVMHLRNALRSVPSVGSSTRAHAVLETRGPGYLVHAGPGELDAAEFRRHADLGRSALAGGDDYTGSRHLRAGLELWQGAVLSDVATGPVLSALVTRLEAAKLTALEQCLAAELRLGRHHDLLSELTALVRYHPVNETLHTQYMLALYRSGRQVEALDVYQAVVSRLRADLGVDPADEIRKVHSAILRADPALDVPELSPV
jgi:SARP family transcriptional regulator, regulator of embCAB operon